MFDPVKFPDTVNLNDRREVDPVRTHEADVKDGGASNIKEFLKILDKSHEHPLQWETVSQLGDTSSAVSACSLPSIIQPSMLMRRVISR